MQDWGFSYEKVGFRILELLEISLNIVGDRDYSNVCSLYFIPTLVYSRPGVGKLSLGRSGSNILYFAGHSVSAATTQLCHWSTEATTDN